MVCGEAECDKVDRAREPPAPEPPAPAPEPTAPPCGALLVCMLLVRALLVQRALFALELIVGSVGCGEVTYHADGTWTTNESAFLPHKQARGEW